MSTTDHTPDAATAQRRAALEEANRRRTAGADLKKRVAAGLVYVDEVVTGDAGDDQQAGDSLTVYRLILAAPRIGPVKARAMLRYAGVPSDKQVRLLTPGQREKLADVVRYHAPWTTAAGR